MGVILEKSVGKLKNRFSKVLEQISWTHEWYYSKTGRQTRIWFPSLNKKFSRSLMSLNRTDLGLMVEIISGHNRLNRHQNIVSLQRGE